MMSPDAIGALLALAFAAAWTPGPNNAMLAASGATFGFRRTLPHALGVTLGFPAMIFLVALGLGRVFHESETLRETLRWGGAALLVWIAWRIATAERPAQARADRSPSPSSRPRPSSGSTRRPGRCAWGSSRSSPRASRRWPRR